MNKRIFAIDKDCFIVYTGLSSADRVSFLRIGTSSHVTKALQQHIRYIVVPDVRKVDVELEKKNISSMQAGKIRYICNRTNQDALFKALSEVGVDIDGLYHRDLSREIDSINKLENKKHFFTVFYENKNIKLLYDDEIFFDLFDAKGAAFSHEEERTRLSEVINTLDTLHTENSTAKFNVTEVADVSLMYQKCAMFIMQDNYPVTLNPAMFNLKKKGKKGAFQVIFNSAHRFKVGNEIGLIILEKGKKRILLKGVVTEGEVLHQGILYLYQVQFPAPSDILESQAVMQFYDYLLEKSENQ